MSCFSGHFIAVALLATSAAEPSVGLQPGGLQVELTTLSGQRLTGALVGLSADQAALKSAGRDTRTPVAEILEIRALRAKPPAGADPRRPELTLNEGSRLAVNSLSVVDRRLLLETPQLGKVAIPVTSAASIRLAPLDSQVAEAWKELSARELNRDMLVIRKGNVLDHLDGTAGAINQASIHFVLDGEDHALNREKVFGVIYARRNVEVGKAACEITTTGGDLLKAQSVTLDGAVLKVGLLGGAPLVIPATQIVSLDFSAGKVRYLSQLDPKEEKYTPFFDQIWTYCRDHPRDGGALRLGNKEYARGLWIHSRTLLKYRLNGDYRRFQAVMGIDQAVAPLGNVHVVISGDGKTLRECDVRGTDAPQNLDLDVAGVRDLEILVDFGGDLDIADHLDLADARVIK